MNEVLLRSCMEADGSHHALVTDPPYGVSGTAEGWDAGDVPPPLAWSAIRAALLPGAHGLVMGHPRTFHHLGVALEKGGFEIRDTISWIYGGGFPKNQNVQKIVDRKYPGGDVQWDGWGTALKPAWNPIFLVRNPLASKTVADNVVQHGAGAINIDASRFPTTDKLGGGAEKETRSDQKSGIWSSPWMDNPEARERHAKTVRENVKKAEVLGRFPSNVAVDQTVAEQFAQIPNRPERFVFRSRATKKERNAGLDEDNLHTTVKPIDLMEWMIRMVTPEGGSVLDPFAGSGTTGVAAVGMGFQFTGYDIREEYVRIANKRIAHAAV